MSAQRTLPEMGVTGDGVVTADVGETPRPSVMTSSEALSCVMVVPSMASEGSPLGVHPALPRTSWGPLGKVDVSRPQFPLL